MYAFKEIWRFSRFQLWHLLLLIPGALAITFIHESAHAFAVLVQGGVVDKFVWLPTTDRWGYITYRFPDDVNYSSFIISIAPYALWTIVAISVVLISPILGKQAIWIRSFVFVWLFFVPLADIANAAFPFLIGNKSNDLSHAFGSASGIHFFVVFGGCLTACILGYFVQRFLYQERSLSVSSYTLAATTTVVAITGFCALTYTL